MVPVLYFTGNIIKSSNIANRFIPLLLGAISIFVTGLWIFATSEASSVREIFGILFSSITQGILLAGASVYTNEFIKQFKVKCDEDK